MSALSEERVPSEEVIAAWEDYLTRVGLKRWTLDGIMTTQQVNATELLSLLESSELQVAEDVRSLLVENLNVERGPWLMNSLVDYYMSHNSDQALQILCSVREPHDKHLLDKLNECMARAATRLPSLNLLGHVVRRQPSWIHKIYRAPVFASLLKCLKTDSNEVVLTTGVLVLATLLPMIPQAVKQHVHEIFDIFSRLASWGLKNAGHVPEVCVVHLHAGVYALFHRLYGMYPCNFLSYLRAHYSMRENSTLFTEVILPMVERVRVHPELVTGTKEYEMDTSKWKKYETQDVVIECAKVSLDSKEASSEEGFCPVPDQLPLHCLSQATPDVSLQSGASLSGSISTTPTSSRMSHSSTPMRVRRLSMEEGDVRGHQKGILSSTAECSEVGWSPANVCGMSTPPSSRGMSPVHNQSDVAHGSSSQHAISGTPLATPTTSPGPTPSDEYVHISLDSTGSCADAQQEKPRPGVSETGSAGKVTAPSIDRSLNNSAAERHAAKSSAVEVGKQAESEGGGESAVGSPGKVSLKELQMVIENLASCAPAEKDGEDVAVNNEVSEINEMCPAPADHRGGFDSPFFSADAAPPGTQAVPGTHGGEAAVTQAVHQTSRSTSNKTQDRSTTSSFALTPASACGRAAAVSATCYPYEHLFALAFPRAAVGAFVDHKSAELRGLDGSHHSGSPCGVAPSPLDVIDVLMQRGGDVHAKELSRLSLPSQAADWTHFGGSVPPEEMHLLHSRLHLLHAQLLYERHKREQHALRNRRLLRKVITATALQEQNAAMRDQLRLQDEEILVLRRSLTEEQQRSQQQRMEKEQNMGFYQVQLRSLQSDRDSLSASNRELQCKLDETYRDVVRLKVELQKANCKVYDTIHELQRLQEKLESSETLSQQADMLNRQLLVLGELNELYREELHNINHYADKEGEMCLLSHRRELEKARQCMRQQAQRVDAASRRINDLENSIMAKDILLLEQKRFLENVKNQGRSQQQAMESKYKAQKRINQALESHMLELYSCLEVLESPAGFTDRPLSLLCRKERALGGNVADADSATPLPVAAGPERPASLLPGAPIDARVPLVSDPPSAGLMGVAASNPYPPSRSFLGQHARELLRSRGGGGCDDNREDDASADASSAAGVPREPPSSMAAPASASHARGTTRNLGGGGQHQQHALNVRILQQRGIMDYDEK
ncbi:hamartin isoform X2 [Petromyzon marinus]|uniref:hamartin isoform X2 n=1 Tax=Petromyzon marinus TaxID=7757 RepID=UPI003F72A6BA